MAAGPRPANGHRQSTIAAAFAVQRLGQAQGRVLALVHRQDLALQLAETLRHEELEVGLVMEGSRTVQTPVVVATVQSLTLHESLPFDLSGRRGLHAGLRAARLG